MLLALCVLTLFYHACRTPVTCSTAVHASTNGASSDLPKPQNHAHYPTRGVDHLQRQLDQARVPMLRPLRPEGRPLRHIQDFNLFILARLP